MVPCTCLLPSLLLQRLPLLAIYCVIALPTGTCPQKQEEIRRSGSGADAAKMQQAAAARRNARTTLLATVGRAGARAAASRDMGDSSSLGKASSYICMRAGSSMGVTAGCSARSATAPARPCPYHEVKGQGRLRAYAYVRRPTCMSLCACERAGRSVYLSIVRLDGS